QKPPPPSSAQQESASSPPGTAPPTGPRGERADDPPRRQWRRVRSGREPRTVFDPLLPPEVALTLESSPVALRAARTHGKETTRHPAYPDRPGPERAHLREAARKARKGGGVDPFTVFATIAFLLIVAGLTNMSGLLMAAVAVGVVAAVRQGVLDGANRGARRRLRIAMEYGDRYVLPEDLDRNCR